MVKEYIDISILDKFSVHERVWDYQCESITSDL